MGKVNPLKVPIKTYGKKNTAFKKKKSPIIINNVINLVNIENNFYTVNYITNHSDIGGKNSSHQFSTSSASGDEFDKLLKGAVCNKQSTYSDRRFLQRQDTPNFSEVTSGTPSSDHLFKDLLDSDSHDAFSSAHLKTPPSYQWKNKKLVKVTVTNVKKNQVLKVGKRKVKCKRLNDSPKYKKRQSATSSTPTYPGEVVTTSKWILADVSPILPKEHEFLCLKGKHSPTFDISALAEGFEKLGIATRTANNFHKESWCDQEEENCTPKMRQYFGVKEIGSGFDMGRKKLEFNWLEHQEDFLDKHELTPNEQSQPERNPSCIEKNINSNEGIDNINNNKGRNNINNNETPNISLISNNRHRSNKARPSEHKHDCSSPTNHLVEIDESNNLSKINKSINLFENSSSDKTESPELPTRKDKIILSEDHEASSKNSSIHNLESNPGLELLAENSVSPREKCKQECSTENYCRNLQLELLTSNNMNSHVAKEESTSENKNSVHSPGLIESTDLLRESDLSNKQARQECLSENDSSPTLDLPIKLIEKSKRSAIVKRAEIREDLHCESNYYNSPLKTRSSKLLKNRGSSCEIKSFEENLSQREGHEKINQNKVNYEAPSSISARNLSLGSNAFCEADTSKTNFRLSLKPGKSWKRSIAMYRHEENRKSLNAIRERRSTIQPHTLAKMIGSNLAGALNDTLNETLPILKEGSLDTITKRRKRKDVINLDVVQEEGQSDEELSLNHGSVIDELKTGRASLDMFQDEASYCDEFIFSGINTLSNIDSSQMHEDNIPPNCITTNEECKAKDIRLGVLARCGQETYLPFSDVFTNSLLSDCQKIGEGVYGEVFMLKRSRVEKSVVKIIPVEGNQLVNSSPQKLFEEVLSEVVISEELSSLRYNTYNYTSGFCELKKMYCLQGVYPSKLLKLWKKFDKEKRSENDCPDMFKDDQLFMVLELDHGGQPLESYKFDSTKKAISVLFQIIFSLAVAESGLQFEHRDLHIGNVLIKPTKDQYIEFILGGCKFELPTFGVKATIIDFTLSRISFEGDVIFFDLAQDPELFMADGDDYQFEIYRLMRNDVDNNWILHEPKTNIRWLDYLVDKLICIQKRRPSKKTRTEQERHWLNILEKLRENMQNFKSSYEFSNYLLTDYKEILDIHFIQPKTT